MSFIERGFTGASLYLLQSVRWQTVPTVLKDKGLAAAKYYKTTSRSPTQSKLIGGVITYGEEFLEYAENNMIDKWINEQKEDIEEKVTTSMIRKFRDEYTDDKIKDYTSRVSLLKEGLLKADYLYPLNYYLNLLLDLFNYSLQEDIKVLRSKSESEYIDLMYNNLNKSQVLIVIGFSPIIAYHVLMKGVTLRQKAYTTEKLVEIIRKAMPWKNLWEGLPSFEKASFVGIDKAIVR